MPADHEVSKVSNKLQAAKDFDATMNGSDQAPVVKDDDNEWDKVNEDDLFGETDPTDALGKGAPITQSSVSLTATEAG